MREQGSLKGEGTHRGNLFVHNSEQNLPTCSKYHRRFKGILYIGDLKMFCTKNWYMEI